MPRISRDRFIELNAAELELSLVKMANLEKKPCDCKSLVKDLYRLVPAARQYLDPETPFSDSGFRRSQIRKDIAALDAAEQAQHGKALAKRIKSEEVL